MKNKRIWERTNRELKRNLAIGFVGWLMGYVITELWDTLIKMLWLEKNNYCLLLSFFIKLVIVFVWTYYWLREIGKMDFKE